MDQRGTHILSARSRIDVPPFDKRDAVGVATLRIRADRKLGEADGHTSAIERQQHFERFTSLTGEVAIDRVRMVGRRPQRGAHALPGVAIVPFSGAYQSSHAYPIFRNSVRSARFRSTRSSPNELSE